MTSRYEPATMISWSLPRQRDVTPYRSPGCADVLRGARADVTDFSYMTLMGTSVVKHNMLKTFILAVRTVSRITVVGLNVYLKIVCFAGSVKTTPSASRHKTNSICVSVTFLHCVGHD